MNITSYIDSSITNSALAAQIEGAVQAAVNFYQHVFSNSVNLNIQFRFATTDAYGTPLGGLVANNDVRDYFQPYSQITSHLNPANAPSNDQRTAWNTVPAP